MASGKRDPLPRSRGRQRIGGAGLRGRALGVKEHQCWPTDLFGAIRCAMTDSDARLTIRELAPRVPDDDSDGAFEAAGGRGFHTLATSVGV